MSNLHYYKETFTRGLSNRFLLYFVFIIAILFVIYYILFRYLRDNTRIIRAYSIREDDETFRTYNTDQRCPVCLCKLSMSVVTLCGHIFCGLCLRSLYHHNNFLITSCPICRQMIEIIFIFFDEEELNSIDAEVIASRDLVLNFIKKYNRRYSGRPRSIADHLEELPSTLKNVWSDFFRVDGLLRNISRIQIIISIISGVVYFFLPTDAVPARVFEIRDITDDVLNFVIILLLLYEHQHPVANENLE